VTLRLICALLVLAFASACSWGIAQDLWRHGRLVNGPGPADRLGYPEHIAVGAITTFSWGLGLWLLGAI